MDPVSQPLQPIGIEESRPQAQFLRAQLQNFANFWPKLLHRVNRMLPKDGTEAMTGPLEMMTYTVSTLPTASAYTGSVIYVSDGGPRFSRALVSKSANQSISDITNTALIWQTEQYDDGGWFASSGDEFFTVPTGVTQLRLIQNVVWAGDGTGVYRSSNFTQDGAAFVGYALDTELSLAGIADVVGTSSPIVDCAAGEKYRVSVYHVTGNAVNVLTHNGTYFGVEAMEFAEGYGGTFQGSNGTRWVPLG